MEQLQLFSMLQPVIPKVISFYGAGGKTTLMRRLASEMSARGHKVLLTTTTKILPINNIPLVYDKEISRAVLILEEQFKKNNIVVLGSGIIEDGKINGLLPGDIERLKQIPEVCILIEADGAKGKPLKGYADHEPVLPPCSDLIIPVIGADALGGKLNDDYVHRLPLLLKDINFIRGDEISAAVIAETYKLMLSFGRKQAPGARIKIIMNKADLLQSAGAVIGVISNELAGNHDIDHIIFTDAREENPVKIILPRDDGLFTPSLSCVVLAAGFSKRMGRDKLALQYKGKTILEHSLDTVLQAGLNEIILVTGSHSILPETIKSMPIRVIVNHLSSSGLASSLQAGLQAVSNSCQGAIFAHADQPLVSPKTYKILCDSYKNTLNLFTAPTFKNFRGNPTIFDRRIWPALMKIKGDYGGKAIIDKIPNQEINLIETDSEAVIKDLDSLADYQALLYDQ